MISNAEAKTAYTWATKDSKIEKLFGYADNLKGIGNNKTLAIIVPSFLLHNIDYMKLLKNPNIDTMGVNCCYLIPGCENLTYYLPFTTAHKTRSKNNDPIYQNWIRNYKGLVMHGLLYNDGTNGVTPYALATIAEVKEIIAQAPNTKFTIWRHSWGDYVKSRGVPGMLEFPYFDQWTPSRLPWAHCGAICGFAIPMAMALGYSRIYVVGMGYRYVTMGYHNASSDKSKADQGRAYDGWLQFAPTRMSNQMKLAHSRNIILRVGPKPLLEPELPRFYNTFMDIDEII